MQLTKDPDHTLALWALGQEGFLVKAGNTTILFDPYLSASEHRKFAPPLLPEQCKEVDYVICSHHHGDHMDQATLQRMKLSEKTKFIVPRTHIHLMKEWGFADKQIMGISHLEYLSFESFELAAHVGKHEYFGTG